MTSSKNLLVELFVEELPPKALKKLGEVFASLLAENLKSQGLAAADAVVTPFASPRRLALHLGGVAAKAPDRAVQHKLMPVGVAFDANGQPTPALMKRLLGLGAGAEVVPTLQRRVDGKAEAVFFDTVVPGAALDEGLQRALDETLAKLPIPKLMSYQLDDGWSTVHFVRPVHGLVALHGDAVVRCYALGLVAGRNTQGHRFEATRHPIELRDADSYAEQLKSEGAVIASFGARRAELESHLKAAAAREGLVPIDDDALLDEVTALVERPNVLLCAFESQFLAVPAECLILTMKANQKYFPLLDRAGKLTHKFLVVSNIRPADASRVVEGNERVVRPRLADAKFFFDQDRKKTLASRVPALAKVVYHGKLGTQGERVERLRQIARWVAKQLGSDVDLADRAAMLAKADLLTDMVGEFPELQGIMGGYYARHDGEHEDVAAAIADQYAFRRDQLESANNLTGNALLLADRAEALIGIWSIGERPTGDKDPFALRRHALAIISSFEICGAAAAIGARAFGLTIYGLLETARSSFERNVPDSKTVAEVKLFILERYANQLAPMFGAQAVSAVISQEPPLHEVVKRTRAVVEFQRLAEAASLAAANKRVGNILKKAEGGVTPNVDTRLLNEPAETALNEALRTVAPQADAAFERGDYTASLRALAALKTPVDEFFDGVLVNADDAALRANRLGLLATLHAAMNRVADLSKLAV